MLPIVFLQYCHYDTFLHNFQMLTDFKKGGYLLIRQLSSYYMVCGVAKTERMVVSSLCRE